ncbi:MAG: MBL fold metallo-hydrolase, partial [Caldilineaceae bacterium]|nr:MBL fold metallo-hydrolase [Caldilineaceae bacterium]
MQFVTSLRPADRIAPAGLSWPPTRAAAPTQLTYVGHATVLVEIDGVRLITDPILRNRVSFLRRHQRTGFDPAAYRQVDAALISHLHLDHLDLPSLRLLGQDTRLIVPSGAGAWLRGQGFRRVAEVRIGEEVMVGPVCIHATYADHDAARHRFGWRVDQSLGYRIQGSHTVYFSGDTDLFAGMADLGGGLDVALLPVWGWGPTLGAGHMDPRRAAEALALLQPRLAVPIHWGALRPTGFGLLNPSFLAEPPHVFAAYAAQMAPRVEVQIVPPGGALALAF